MTTKGPSNHFGNTKNGRQGHKTIHTGFAWAKDFNKSTLKKHFEGHGKHMGFDTIDAYKAHAISFANTVNREDCESFIDKNGSTYKYNKVTNEFAIITSDGYVVTYYCPENQRQYYLDQKEKYKK